MKRIILALIFLLATSSAAPAQSSADKENLRGLTGVWLIVTFGKCPSRDFSNCAEGLDEAKRPEVLKMVEANATAKLREGGIPLYGLVDERNFTAGGPRLIVAVTLAKLNGFLPAVETEVKLLQRVRLVRDQSIEYDAVTWRQGGVGGPKLEVRMIHSLVANNLDDFIEDYLAVNPKQSAGPGKEKTQE
jgi:hypothetical protein